MANLELPDGPAELLEAVRLPLGEYLGGEHKIHLGGGTALIARWKHRHSNDLDLVVQRKPYNRLFKHRAALEVDLENQSGGPAQVYVTPEFAHIIWTGGEEINISTGTALTGDPVSSDTVSKTRITLENSTEVLAKMLYYRLLDLGLIAPRDLYDIATARKHDLEALQVAFSTLDVSELKNIVSVLGRLRGNWMQQQKEQPINPSSRYDAHNAVHIVREQIDRHLRRRIRPSTRNQDS